ncbi:MAG: amidophosphoribosyltransferase [Candidatus Eisenbacteria bacterium]|nr:amidophosphoribosyltransferase [Candidatus Eisenbacteria bacterium]
MTPVFHEECGIFGVSGNCDAARLSYLGLYALQHRGQESAGIVTWDGDTAFQHRAMGLVNSVFDETVLDLLPGHVAIGHVRYSTTGQSRLMNAQPILVRFRGGSLAAAHNGNLVDADRLRSTLEAGGAVFRTTTDTETILHLIARAYSKKPGRSLGELPSVLSDALAGVQGAYSVLLMIDGTLVAVRDPRGYRPLCFGALGSGGWAVASESCALDIVGAKLEREIAPGEIVVFDPASGPRAFPLAAERSPESFCVFEYIYFLRPDSVVRGVSVDGVRRALGRRLAKEHPADADVVIAVPDSSNSAAMGFSEGSGIPLEIGLIRNHYIGRTFIHPKQSLRDLRVRIKYNPVADTLARRRVVVVDDSIVRGTTSRKLMRMIRDAGAREVHLRVASPPIRFPCFYGIDTPTKGELIAASKEIEEIARFIGVDSLGYVSFEGLLASSPPPRESYCVACFDGSYPHECILDSLGGRAPEKGRP